jgi:hypothetical protein
MAIRYKKKTSQREKRFVMVIILAVIIVLIMVAFGAVAMFGTVYYVDASLDDPAVLLHVSLSGDDIIIGIYGGREADNLVQLEIEVEGYAHVFVDVPPGAKEVVISHAAYGVTGTRTVGVHGIFRDGKNVMLIVSSIKFT